jgi:hypothetical protein
MQFLCKGMTISSSQCLATTTTNTELATQLHPKSTNTGSSPTGKSINTKGTQTTKPSRVPPTGEKMRFLKKIKIEILPMSI